MMSEDDSDGGELVIDDKLDLTSCPARFNGIIDKEATEEFIGKIECFKHAHKIPDTCALRDIAVLFKGPALSWWKGVKDAVNTWKDAVTLIRYVYAPTKPPDMIYAEIFSQKQDDVETEVFVDRKRKLFLQLPKAHPEDVQIDMIYWMLNHNIKLNIPRDSIDTFDELVHRARSIERELPQGHANGKKKRKRCGFCRINGHVTEECRKRMKKLAEMETDLLTNDSIDVKVKEEKPPIDVKVKDEKPEFLY